MAKGGGPNLAPPTTLHSAQNALYISIFVTIFGAKNLQDELAASMLGLKDKINGHVA